jgi:hypothetical protein
MRLKSAKYVLLIAAIVLAFGLSPSAQAELTALSEDRITVLADEGPFDFPLWYQDAKFLKLQACLDNPDMCLQELADPNGEEEPVVEGLEFIYWAAESIIDFPAVPGADDNGQARFILALEAFVDQDPDVGPDPFNGVFNAVIVRLRGVQPNTPYTITHPFAAQPVVAVSDDRGRLLYEVPALHPEGTAEELFLIALEGPIQHFLYSDTLLPIAVGDSFYIGDPTFVGTDLVEGHTIFGSPYGINHVRVEGPGLPGGFIFSDRFAVAGQVFFGEDQNLAPVANSDLAGALPGTPVNIDVLGNDQFLGDVPINPTSLEKTGAVAGATGGTVAPVRELDKVLLRFTPNAGFTGIGSFTYTAESFTGLPSDPATVNVFVEDLQFDAADYRTRTGRWSLNGTSNFDELTFSPGEGLTSYFTSLVGGQEVPPVASAASGNFTATFDSAIPASFNTRLEATVPAGTTFTRAHIHLGETGTNGGILFDLCGEEGSPDCTPVNGVISVDNLLSEAEFNAVGDVTTFDQAVEAIQNGRTYVNVHSVAFPGGEIRGQIGRNVIVLKAGETGPVIGTAEVQPAVGNAKPWSFSGKSRLSPGSATGGVSAESSAGNAVVRDLSLR